MYDTRAYVRKGDWRRFKLWKIAYALFGNKKLAAVVVAIESPALLRHDKTLQQRRYECVRYVPTPKLSRVAGLREHGRRRFFVVFVFFFSLRNDNITYSRDLVFCVSYDTICNFKVGNSPPWRRRQTARERERQSGVMRYPPRPVLSTDPNVAGTRDENNGKQYLYGERTWVTACTQNRVL